MSTHSNSLSSFQCRGEKETPASHLGRQLKEKRYLVLSSSLKRTIESLSSLGASRKAVDNDDNQDPLFAVSGRLRDYWPGWTNWPGRSEGKTCRMKLDSLSLMRLLLGYITARVPRLLFLILSITHHFLPRVFAGPSAEVSECCQEGGSCGTKGEIFFIFVIGGNKDGDRAAERRISSVSWSLFKP